MTRKSRLADILIYLSVHIVIFFPCSEFLSFFIKGRPQLKKNVFFRALPESLKPPPLTPIRATWSSFFGRQNSRVESQPKTTFNNLKQPKKTIKSAIHWHFWRNRLFLLTKNALLERGPKNSGRGSPPPLIRAMPERKRFFSIDLVPYLHDW